MTDNVISHNEMCRREGVSLQRGMNFGLGGNHSVILMSVRPNAPYRDRLEEGGTVLIYEGHDHPKGGSCTNPKVVDQPDRIPSGGLTQNGKFHEAAQSAERLMSCTLIHILPFSKGGTSLTAANVQLLCARHDIEKRDKIA